MPTIALTAATFAETLKKDGIVLIDFWAEWCGPCKRFAPIFEAASEKHPDVVFAKVDTDAEQQIAASFEIRSIPTIMAFRDGLPVFAQPGMLPPQALEQVIAQVRALDMADVKKQLEEHAKGHEHGPGCDHDH